MPCRTRNSIAIPALFLVGLLLATPNTVTGQVPQETSPDQSDPAAVEVDLPTSLDGTNWKATGPVKTLSGDQLRALPDSEILAEYGLSKLHVRHYADGKLKLVAESFEFIYPSRAFGYWTSSRREIGNNRRELVSGRYLISLMKVDGSEVSWPQLENAFSQAFARANISRLSPLVSHLPEENKTAGTERYIVGPVGLAKARGLGDLAKVIDFSDGAEAAVAEYANGGGSMRLAIIEFHTPQSATVGHNAAVSALNALSDDARSKRIVKRTGNYVVIADGVADIAAAQSIVDKVKYTIQIHWEGKKFTSIPIDFRPPDPAALAEAAETATVLLRTFYGIGILLLGTIIIGVFSGWVIFYWRRYKRRRLGLANVFSDAGGTLRLNLDDYLLEAGETKLLGGGDG